MICCSGWRGSPRRLHIVAAKRKSPILLALALLLAWAFFLRFGLFWLVWRAIEPPILAVWWRCGRSSWPFRSAVFKIRQLRKAPRRRIHISPTPRELYWPPLSL